MFVRLLFVSHQSKNVDNHKEIRASYARVRTRTALLNCLADSICSTVHETYIPDSTIRSDKPPSHQSLSLHALKQDNVWKPPRNNIWFLNSSGCDYFTCCAIAYSCLSKVWIESCWPAFVHISTHLFTLVYTVVISVGFASTIGG